MPTATKKTMPPTISSVYRTNIVRTVLVEFVSKHVCPACGGAVDDLRVSEAGEAGCA
jgi:hypothetical protein